MLQLQFNENFLNDEKYEFLKTDQHLGPNIILLGYGGSHAYGTNVPTSDIDVRGIASNTMDTVLGIDTFEQRENRETDTIVYSITKAINLLANCNPNVIEILGLDNYFVKRYLGNLLLANKDMFLSKKVINSFGGYATAQLRRLQNALAHDSYPEAEKNRHILGSIENTISTFNDRYQNIGFDIKVRLNANNELVTDMCVAGYPLRDTYGMFSEMKAVIREYDKLNHRNNKKDNAHLNKHAMHLIRLLIMGEEILRTKEIHTYRAKEHDLLMNIRNGKYQKEDGTFCSEFFDMLDEYEKQFRYAADNTELPDKPDKSRIDEYIKVANLSSLAIIMNTFHYLKPIKNN